MPKTSFQMCKRMLSFFVIALSIEHLVHGHSHLARPLPTRRLDCRAGNGRPRDCYGPCPPIDTYGEPTGISAYHPAETWRRGERRTVSWHRNNHGDGESGFVRLSLVPVSQMMDEKAHEKFTFQISCWSSGLHWCPSRDENTCGNDGEGKAYKVPVVVPSSYPDGVYAFGWAWYGGGDYRGYSYFGDYFSCSFIRIEGGYRVTSSCKPVFVPGVQQRYSDACLSAADKVGYCVREPCHIGPVTAMRPKNLPQAIYAKDLRPQVSYVDSFGQPESNAVQEESTSVTTSEKKKPFKVEGLQVFDLSTNKIRVSKKRKLKIRLSGFRKGFTIGLQVSGAVQKVRFDMKGYDHTEYVEPYVINGNVGGNLEPLRCSKGKTMKLTCTVFGPGDIDTVKYKIKCI